MNPLFHTSEPVRYVAVALVALTLVWWLCLLDPGRWRRSRCGTCGYDLGGHEASRCPECGGDGRRSWRRLLASVLGRTSLVVMATVVCAALWLEIAAIPTSWLVRFGPLQKTAVTSLQTRLHAELTRRVRAELLTRDQNRTLAIRQLDRKLETGELLTTRQKWPAGMEARMLVDLDPPWLLGRAVLVEGTLDGDPERLFAFSSGTVVPGGLPLGSYSGSWNDPAMGLRASAGETLCLIVTLSDHDPVHGRFEAFATRSVEIPLLEGDAIRPVTTDALGLSTAGVVAATLRPRAYYRMGKLSVKLDIRRGVLPDDVALGARIDLVVGDRIVAAARFWNSPPGPRARAPAATGFDTYLLELQHLETGDIWPPPDRDTRCELRLRSDRDMALRAVGKTRHWVGEVRFPVY